MAGQLQRTRHPAHWRLGRHHGLQPRGAGYVYDKPTYASDFPGGEWRRMRKPTGMRYILVNGAVTFESNNCTGALPGKLLRSYDMID